MFVFWNYYLQSVLHYSALAAGFAFVPFTFGIVLAAGFSSGIIPRIGPRIPMTMGTPSCCRWSGLAIANRGTG